MFLFFMLLLFSAIMQYLRNWVDPLDHIRLRERTMDLMTDWIRNGDDEGLYQFDLSVVPNSWQKDVPYTLEDYVVRKTFVVFLLYP